MLKIIVDNIVLLAVCCLSIVLPIFQMGAVARFFSTEITLPLFVGLYFANALVLMWLWKRLGPTRTRKKDAISND